MGQATVVASNRVQACVQSLVCEGFEGIPGAPPRVLESSQVWRGLREVGTQLWLDTGDMEEAAALYTADFEALTTNNTLLNREVQKGLYDDLITEAARAIQHASPDIDERDLILEVAFVLNARHGLRLVQRFNAHVSVELHTDLADDADRSIAFGRRFHAICPERFIIKVPLTPAGFLAARRLSQDGIPVNFTLGFSARQNLVAALLARPRYVNVFMGRLNAFVADNDLGDGRNVGEKATLATQRMLLDLRRQGRSDTLLIGASMRSGAQAGALAGLDVFTMPTQVAAQYAHNPLPVAASRVEHDPEVPLHPGVMLSHFNGATLWDIPKDFGVAVNDLLQKEDLDDFTPWDVQTHFELEGFPDFLPRWSEEDIETARHDGKIPVYMHWRPRLEDGEIGLDALMNIAALQSFVTDQAELDRRIREQL